MTRRTLAGCGCDPNTLHRIVGQRKPCYWVTTLVRGECGHRTIAEGLVLWRHLDPDRPERDEDEELPPPTFSN